MNEQKSEKKKRLVRGRLPGVPLKEYRKRDNPNERKNLRRFSVSVPVEMDRIIRAVRVQCDIEFAKIFRAGLDEFMRMNREKISEQTYRAYWVVRKQVDDQQWGKD